MTWARKAGERLRAMRSDEGAVDALIALLHWLRGDRVERPWRLTRRQRVEMEALRSRMYPGPTLSQDIDRACRILGWTPLVTDRFPDGLRQWRVLRARVAIALRAALRADEDARVSDAYGYAYRKAADDFEAWHRTGKARCAGSVDALDAMREWPAMPWGRVPLALWEVVR